MNRADFQGLADLRIAEAECLFRNGFFEGAYYLAGYSVECGLKACIAKQTRQYDFPDGDTKQTHYVHNLDKLIKTAGLGTILEADRKANADLNSKWVVVFKWRESNRYDPRGMKVEADAQMLIQAITDTSQGVLPWIKQRW